MRWVEISHKEFANDEEREVALLRTFFCQRLSRLLHVTQQAMNWYGYLCEIITALYIMLSEIMVLNIAVSSPHALVHWSQWSSTFVWAVAPSYHLPAHFLPPTLFWQMFLVPLTLFALPWVAIALLRNAWRGLTAWRYAPELRLAYIIQRERALLSYLYVQAQFENTPYHFWKQSNVVEEGKPLFSPLVQTTISKHAGPSSFLYVTLSNYLSLPPWAPESGPIERDLAPRGLIATIEQQVAPHTSPLSREAEDVEIFFEIFCFGKVRVRHVGTSGQGSYIEKRRLAALLVFLAVHTRGKTIRSEMIVSHFYELEEGSGKEKKQLRYALYNDISDLRTLFKDLFQQADVPYSDPLLIEGHGPGARWSLSPSLALVDITMLETAAKQLAVAKLQVPEDMQRLRAVYETALHSYTEDFLEELWREGAVGSWAKRYRQEYRAMHRQLLWDAAEYEQAFGEHAVSEEQRDCFTRSMQLYRDYAFITMPGQASERALQHSMKIARKMEEKQLADRAYCEYSETMKRRFPDREIDPATTAIWQEAVGE